MWLAGNGEVEAGSARRVLLNPARANLWLESNRPKSTMLRGFNLLIAVLLVVAVPAQGIAATLCAAMDGGDAMVSTGAVTSSADGMHGACGQVDDKVPSHSHSRSHACTACAAIPMAAQSGLSSVFVVATAPASSDLPAFASIRLGTPDRPPLP
jgi:hypothetical protein